MKKSLFISRLVFSVCLAVIFVHAFFFYKDKHGLFLDEAYSFQLANNDVLTFNGAISAIKNDSINEFKEEVTNKILGENTWVTQSEIIDEYTVKNTGKLNFFDIYVVNAGDVHPPLYYFAINIFSTIFSNISIYSIGFIINIISLLVVCYLIYLIGMFLFGNRVLSLAAMLYYGLSFDSINSVTYYRMYALLTLWCVLLIYLHLLWYQSDFNNKRVFKFICISEFMGMMTQYFAVFYIFPLFLISLILMISKHYAIKKYIIGNVVTGLIYLLVWPISIVHILFSDRGHDVAGNLSAGGLVSKILGYKGCVVNSLFSGSNKYFKLFVILVIAILIFKSICLFKESGFKNLLTSNLFITMIYIAAPAILFFIVAAYTVPWQVDRYIMPAMPVFALLIVYFISEAISLILKNKNIGGIVLAIFALIICVRWHHKLVPYYLYNSNERVAYQLVCGESEAIVIDDEQEKVNLEVEVNFPHPRILELGDEHLSNLEEQIDINDDYYLYMRKEKVDSKSNLERFEKMGYEINKLDCESDFYDIYQLHH